MQNTILVVDDSGTNIDILLGLLGESYDIVVATNGSDALETLKNEKIDLILLDIMMPHIDGYDVCVKLKQNPLTCDIPVVFVTAKTDEASIEKAYDVGGVDYVTKPFKAKELQARVKTHLKLQSSLKELEFLASMDSMTGSYNRRKFFDLAKAKFSTMNQTDFAVMIDLDHFKSINDNYGHHIGDEILKKSVYTIMQMMGQEDLFGRLGGEEFVLLMKSATIEDALAKVEEMREQVQNSFIITDDFQKVQVTASFGLAQFDTQYDNIDRFLAQADIALYEAKNNGRNKVHFRKV